MRVFVCVMLAAACAAAPAAYAAETAIDIKGGANGQYFIVEQGGSQNNPTLAVKINFRFPDPGWSFAT